MNPGESVDMPVFFFIDPDVDEDPNCFNMEAVALNYTFHRVQSMEELPRKDLTYFKGTILGAHLSTCLSTKIYGNQLALGIVPLIFLIFLKIRKKTTWFRAYQSSKS